MTHWLRRALAAFLLAAVSEKLLCQEIDATWTFTVNGQTVQANADGSFRIPNVSAADSFGPDGPGSRPDFLSDDFLRVVGRGIQGGLTRHAHSPRFQIRRGGAYSLEDITLTDTPLPLPRSLTVTAARSALAVGETEQLVVTGTLGDGSTLDVTPRTQYTTYRTTNPTVATVGMDGLLTAHAGGAVFIVAVNEGATAVKRFDVASSAVRLRISGVVQLPDGGGAAIGAIVRTPFGPEVVTGSDGSFAFTVDAPLGISFTLTATLEAGGRSFTVAVKLEAVEGLEMVGLGTIVLVEAATDLFHWRVFEVGSSFAAVMTSGDVDGDGTADLALATSTSSTVAVLRNLGDGTFAARVLYNLGGSSPGSITLGDLNGDGDADLATPQGSNVSIFKNQGDGTFAARVSYPCGSSAGSSANGDLDGDGDLDLVVVNQSSAQVSVLVNQGDGTFAAPVASPVGSQPRSVCVGDLDGDGDRDVAVATPGAVTVSVLKNQGDGTFAAYVSYAAGNNPTFVAQGDLDGDGDAELAVVNLIVPASTVSSFRNQGDGTFAARVPYPVGPLSTALAIADLDGDGEPDLTVSNGAIGGNINSNTVSVLRNFGDGTFAPQVFYPMGVFVRPFVLDDFDGDGARDLALSDWDYPAVRIVLNQGDGTFPANAEYNSGGGPRSVSVSDFDADGIPDVAAVNNNSANTVTTLRNRGNATLEPRVTFATGALPIAAVPGDLDGDADIDLAVANNTSGTVSVLLNLGNGLFAAHVQYDAGALPRSIAMGDLDGDGDGDLAVTNEFANTVSILHNQGDGTLAARVPSTVGAQPRAVAMSDLDGDGDADLIVGNANGNSISVLRSQGDGTLAAQVVYPAGGLPESIAPGDLDADGDTDIAVACNSSSAYFAVWRNPGNGVFPARVDYVIAGAPIAVSLYPVGAAIADLDGDGDPDLAMSMGGHNTIAVLRNQGDGTFAGRAFYGVGPRAYSLAPADLDGDGDVDLVVGNYGGVSISVLLNQSIR